MKRKVCFGLLGVIAIIFLYNNLVAVAHAEEINAAKKIISVVYDDSGSMAGEKKWAATNYAMQAFAALLNDQDELYITYMSRVNEKQNIQQIDMSDVQGSVEKIRKDGKPAGGTPLNAIQIAMEKLQAIKEKDVSTQFWLVVMTDGEFNLEDGTEAGDETQKLLDQYAGTKMSNGSQVYINYMGIGEDAISIENDLQKGFDCIMTQNDIVSTLSNIANRVSGRMKFEENQIQKIDDKTVKVHTNIPLYSLSVFSQKSEATVKTVANDEVNLNIERNISLKYPEIEGKETDKTLIGNAALAKNGDKLIPAGDYTITFSKKISLEDSVIMYEPAVKMEVAIKKNGVTIDKDDIVVNDKVDVELIPTNPETGKQIPESNLPKGISWKVSYEVDGQEKEKSDSRVLTGIVIEKGKNNIVCTMQVPDYMPVRQIIDFTAEIPTPPEPVKYDIKKEQSGECIYERSTLGKNRNKKNQVKYSITGDGVILSKKELGDMRLEIIDISYSKQKEKSIFGKLGFKEVSFSLKQLSDGSFILYPKSTVVPSIFLKAGTYKIKVVLNVDDTVTEIGEIKVVSSPKDAVNLICSIVVFVLILYLLYVIFIKPKFNGQRLIIEVYKAGANGTGVLQRAQGDELILKRFTIATFLPGACSVTKCGIKFLTDGTSVYITHKTINQFEAYGGLGVRRPERNFSRIVKSLRETRREKATGEVNLDNITYYLKNKSYLYKITIIS